MVALRLAKAGWWGGDPEKVKRAPADSVSKAMQYEGFLADFEEAFIELNKPEVRA